MISEQKLSFAFYRLRKDGSIMKKRIALVLAICLTLTTVFALSGCGGGSTATPPAEDKPAADAPAEEKPAADAPAGETLELTFAHPFPAGHHHQLQIVDPFIEEIKERTNGRINITVHPGGSISTGQSALDDVTSGAVDFVWTMPGYTAGRFPLSEMLEFPGQWTSAEECTEVIWDLLETNEEFQKEYEGYKLINLYVADVGDIYTKGKAIQKPEDLAGVSYRAPSPMVERIMQALGASTANMPMPEAYDNIERGVVQGLVTGHSAIPTYKLYEVIDNATNGLNIYVSPQMMAMSNAAWDKLTDEDKAIFEEVAMRNISVKSAKLYDQLHDEALAELPGLGVTMYDITDADREAFFAITDPVVTDYISEMEGKGLSAQAFYDDMLAARDARR